MRKTRTELATENQKLSAENTLLSLYLFDTQAKRMPDAHVSEVGKERDGAKFSVRGLLYRATSANGGYVVFFTRGDAWSNVEIMLLDDTYKIPQVDTTFPQRVVSEKLRIARERVLNAAQTQAACATLALLKDGAK